MFTYCAGNDPVRVTPTGGSDSDQHRKAKIHSRVRRCVTRVAARRAFGNAEPMRPNWSKQLILAGKLSDLKLGRNSAIGFVTVALCISVLLLLGHTQNLTGDEVRYLMYAYSILKNGRFAMTLPEWQQLYLSVTGAQWSWALPLAGSGNDVLISSVYLPTLLAPVADLFKLQGLRAATLIVGMIGLLYLLRLCRRFASPSGSLLATGVTGFSIPLLPYLHIFYMQTFLFALVCCAWDRLQKLDRETSGDLITAAIILAIPFVHISGSGVAAALYAALLWQQYRRGKTGLILELLALAGIAFATFVILNLTIYGGITGPVDTRPPLPSEWFAALSMQSFNVRHGLIAYAPVWLLGFAGLWGGALRGSPLAWQGLGLIAIAAATGIAVDAGESWPARFWVLSMPMLGIGLCVFWELGRSAFLRAMVLVLTGATLVNSVIFLCVPNLFLENRQSGATYQFLFDKVGLFDFGLVLPVAVDDTVNLHAARYLAIGSGAIIVFLALALARRRPLFAAPVVVFLLAALDLSRVGVLPQAEYTLDNQPKGFNVALRTPIAAGYVQFGKHWEIWFPSPDFSMVITGADGRQANELLTGNQVLSVSCAGGIRSISVQSSENFDFASQLEARFIFYRSQSLLRNSFSSFRSSC